jgi:stage II sporulation protein D
MAFFQKTPERFVRVAIVNDIEEFGISVRGRYSLVDIAGGQALLQGRRLNASDVSIKNNGIQIGEDWYGGDHVRFAPQKDITIYLNGQYRQYRGTIDIFLKKNRKFLVVNTIELERYIRGVLYHEVSNRWPMEAMKAQAVAARTYALYQTRRNAKEAYDVTSDIYSQVYGGKSAERFRTNIAVNRTRGQIMFFNGQVLPAYYHSSCGGHTEDVRNLWEHDLAPLKGVVCHFCRLHPHSTWKKNYRLKDIQEKLVENGYKIGFIKGISVLDRNLSGRITVLRITARDGTSVDIPGIKFRNMIGPNAIRSNNYDVAMAGYFVDLAGKGWGHGVGMCQWGAYQMSRERYTYDEILQFYYPGTIIKDYQDME